MGQKLIVVLIGGFLAGVIIRSFVDFGWVLPIFFVFLGIIIYLVKNVGHSVSNIFVSLFLIAIAIGIARYEIKDIKTQRLENKVISEVELQGIVIDEPDIRENYTRLIIESKDSKILVYTEHFPEFNYGDEVKINGILKKPKNLNDPSTNSGQVFNWQDYLSKDDIYYEMFYPNIEIITVKKGSLIKRQLFYIKEKFISALNKVIPEPNSSLMAGITIGARKSMPKDLLDDLKKTGIIHVIVLSGYNITLVADFMMRLFSFLPRAAGMGLGVICIILFTIMTGAGAATVRASIMALLVILARATGRIYAITWALFITGFFMVLHNPKILRFDSGFQLSFLATLALIYLAPYFDKKFHFITNKWKIREIISATVATQIFVLPLLLYKTGIFSVVALPVNLLILIFVPITMILGFITAGLGMITTLLSIPFGWFAYLFLQYDLFVVNIFAKLPLSNFNIENFPFLITIAIYILYLVIYLSSSKSFSSTNSIGKPQQ